MALSADKIRTIRTRMRLAQRVANTAQVYGGSFGAIRGQGHATTADRGYAAPFAAAAGNIPLGGAADRSALGDTSATPPTEAEFNVDGVVLEKVAVTGASAQTDVGQWVYLSDDDTLTLTRPSVGMPVGMVVYWFTSTTCDVYMLGLGELLALSANGGGKTTLYLGSFDLATINPTGTPADLRTGIELYGHGKIVGLYALNDVAVTVGTGGDEYDINLEIDTVDVTGGVLSIGASALGAKTSATAITDTNTFHDGSVLDIEVVEGVASADITAGRIDLFAVVEYQPGL